MRFRVVTPDAEEILYEAAQMDVADGHLKLFAIGDYALIASFVPGAWKYCSRMLEQPVGVAMNNPHNQSTYIYAATS